MYGYVRISVETKYTYFRITNFSGTLVLNDVALVTVCWSYAVAGGVNFMFSFVLLHLRLSQWKINNATCRDENMYL